MCIHLQVAIAPELQIHDRMFGEQREHVVEKRNACPDSRLAFAVQTELDRNSGFSRFAGNGRSSRFHWRN
jgi:hypothetical protein